MNINLTETSLSDMSLAKFILSIRCITLIVWGILLHFYGSIPSTELSWLMVFTGSPRVAGTLMTLSGCGCLYAIHRMPKSLLSFAILLLLLPAALIPAVGSIQQVIAEHYADGTPRPWQFILTGQSNTITAGLISVASFVALFWRNNDH